MTKFNMQTPPVSPNEFDISMVLGTMQVPRNRSLSTSTVPKYSEISPHPHHTINRTNSETRSSAPLVSPSPGGASGNNPSHMPPSVNAQSALSPLMTVAQPTSGQGSNDPKLSSAEASSSAPTGGYPDESSGDSAAYGSLGTLYVDSLVERHARRILAEGKLRDLGKLTAHLDFHLVTWLRREKKRKPVMVVDFVAAVKMIHSEFEWPYPEFVASVKSHHSRTPSNDSMKFPHSPEGSSPLKPLTIDVQGHRHGTGSKNGLDSGYNSTPGNQAIEARLLPNNMMLGITQGENSADIPIFTPSFSLSQILKSKLIFVDFDTLSVLSEESMIMDQSPLTPSDYLPMFNLSEGSKQSMLNSSKSAIELRFMQQIMWEAGEHPINNNKLFI